jgi:hypothetical protein
MFNRISTTPVVLVAILAWSFVACFGAQEPAAAPAGGQIVSYDSDINVSPDGTLLVRETLKVISLGVQFQQGTHRDLMTRYHDQFGNPYSIHFDVVSLQRDEQPIEFELEKLSNGLRIDMGSSSETVAPGEHTYELIYSVDRGIGFFPDHDELYWNVTGNGWTFPIQAASATIHLPKGISQIAILLDAYTGGQGSAETNFVASADNDSNATYRTTRALGPHESMTVVVRWPKRFVHLPNNEQKYRYFLEDYQDALVGLAGLVVILIYYGAVWLVLGRATSRGEIEPNPDPPEGFSPAALHYAWSSSFDQKALVTNLIDLAIKNHLAILEDGDGNYILGRLQPGAAPSESELASGAGPSPDITPDERLVLAKIFATGDTIPLGPINQGSIGGAAEALHHHLRLRFEKIYFRANARYLIAGLLIALATTVRAGLAVQGAPRLLVLLLSPALLIIGLLMLPIITLAVAGARHAFSGPIHAPTARKQALVLSAIGLALFLAEVAGLGVLGWTTSPTVVAIALAMVVVNYGFHLLLKTPARSGRGLMDDIESFGLFLTSKGKGRGGTLPIGGAIPQLLERLLPYAMAMNLETVWGERFAAALAQAAVAEGLVYEPGWYSGPGWVPLTASTFATTLGGSLSSAISACARGSGRRGQRAR